MIFHGKRSVIRLHFILHSSGSPVVIISWENVTKKNERSYYNIAYSKKKQKPGSETIINYLVRAIGCQSQNHPSQSNDHSSSTQRAVGVRCGDNISSITTTNRRRVRFRNNNISTNRFRIKNLLDHGSKKPVYSVFKLINHIGATLFVGDHKVICFKSRRNALRRTPIMYGTVNSQVLERFQHGSEHIWDDSTHGVELGISDGEGEGEGDETLTNFSEFFYFLVLRFPAFDLNLI